MIRIKRKLTYKNPVIIELTEMPVGMGTCAGNGPSNINCGAGGGGTAGSGFSCSSNGATAACSTGGGLNGACTTPGAAN